MSRNSRYCVINFFAIIGLSIFSVAAVAAGLKIGYVDAVKVIKQAPQSVAALKRLDAEFAPRNNKLVATREKIKQLEKDLEKNALVLKESDRSAKERELLVIKRDVRRAAQEFREDYNLRRNEEFAEVQKLVYKTTIDIAKQQKFDLILEWTVYASDKIDITDKVLQRLNRKMKKK